MKATGPHRKTFRRYHEPGDLHELTFSCYRRMALLTNDRWRKHLARSINAALEDLNQPKGLNKKGVPLLTTDYYFISDGTDTDQYSALEMDDAVIGYVAGEMGKDYVFVRNISDPIVPTKTQDGADIPTGLREGWSGQVYSHHGFYSSMNGALLTWGTIAGDTSLKARRS